jgi:predicted RNase H-like HicB family nuclease
VVVERSANGWSAYPPDLPGIGVAGATRADTEQLTAEAIDLHLQGLADDGLPIPESDAVDIGHVEAAEPA